MIKGHAVIELKDVATGEVQRVEHDNMLTNGLKYCLTPWLGKFSYASGGATPQKMPNETEETRKSGNRTMMNHLLGGIFLFQNNLEEDADNVAFPTDNPLIGKASWDAYSGMDTYRGSYNTNESGLQDDGSYKHVWDFSTSQANGQISALALTTYSGGICGCGFKDWSNTETAINEAPFFDVGQIRINTSMEGAACPPFIGANPNEIYYVTDKFCLYYNSQKADRHIGTTGKLYLKKKKFPINRLSPFYDYYNQYYSESIEIDAPEEFTADVIQNTCEGRTSNSFLYIYKVVNTNGTINIKPGESLKLMKVRKSDLTSEVVTLTNTTPYNLNKERMCFTDDYLFITRQISPYKIYRISIENNEVIELGMETQNVLKEIGGYIYAKADEKHNYCIIPKTMEVRSHPAFNIIYNNNWKSYGGEKIAPNVYLNFQRYVGSTDSEYDLAYIYISANTLMTINNLSSPIVKTAAQTMKITYTIQETET